MSPASAAKMADVMGLSKGSVDSLQMTATMLSLASKKAIAIYPGPSSLYRVVDMSNADNVRLAGMIGADEGKAKSLGKTMTIVLLPAGFDKDAERELNLSQSERAALSLMQKVSKRVGSPVFDLGGMKRHCEDWKNGYKALNLFTEACSSEFAMLTSSGQRYAGQVQGLYR